MEPKSVGAQKGPVKPTPKEHHLTAPNATPTYPLEPTPGRSLNPQLVVSQILREHPELTQLLTNEVRQAHKGEPDAKLKEIRALEALINATFHTASQGPEFLLPAMASFLKVAEKTRALLGVSLPSVKEAFVDVSIHSSRKEVVSAPQLLTAALKDLMHTSAYTASQIVLNNTGVNEPTIAATFGTSLIRMGTIYRLPRHAEPIENGLLTAAFLTLMEETIHTNQAQLFYLQNNAVTLGKPTFDPSKTLASKLANEFFRETRFDLATAYDDWEAEGSLQMNEIAEIDVLGRLLELAHHHGFPVECLSLELREYHKETRAPFVAWLEQKGIVPTKEDTKAYYFHERGSAREIPSYTKNSGAMCAEAQDLLNLLEDPHLERHLLAAIRTIVADNSSFAILQKRADGITSREMGRVLDNLHIASDKLLVPYSWNRFVAEEYNIHKSALAAVVLEEYLFRIGYLTPTKRAIS